MKLNFTEDELNDIVNIINGFNEVDNKMDLLNKQSNDIKSKIDECIHKMDDLIEREKTIMNNLHKKYGDFSLQDISETIYGK